MSLFKTFRGNKSNLPQDINDGAIYALQDTEEFYIDVSEDKRIKISDVIEVEDKEALPLAPLENKFYYVKDIGSLYKYNGTEYLEISQSPLYIDFVFESIDDENHNYYYFTTTSSYEEVVKKYNKGKKIVAKLLTSDKVLICNPIELEYREDLDEFASDFFFCSSFQTDDACYGQFFWEKTSLLLTPCQLNLQPFGVTSFNKRTGKVYPQKGDYTPEMIGVEDSVLLTSKKAEITKHGGTNSGIFFAKDKFFVFPNGSYGGNFSTDGISWESFSTPYPSCDSIDYGNGMFVAVNGPKLMVSSDCTTWTSQSISSGCLVVRGKDCFVIFPSSKKNTALVFQDENSSLKTVTLPITPNNDWQALYTGSKFIAVADKTLISSENGIDWAVNAQELPYYFHTLAYGNNRLLGIPYGGNPSVVSIDEGNTWTEGAIMPESTSWNAAYGNGKFVAIGTYGSYSDNNSIVAYSENGINWQTADSCLEGKWKTVAYGNNRFVAIDSDGSQAIYSENGTEWSDRDVFNKLFKPNNTDVTEEIKSLVTPDAMTEEEIAELWNSIG